MRTDIDAVPVFGWPWGSTALFQAVQDTVWTPSPLTVTPLAGYDLAPPRSTLQFIPPTPDGPAVAVASTVTAWLTQTLGFASFGVRNDTPTGSLSTDTARRRVYSTPAALVALEVDRQASVGRAPAIECRR